MVHFAPWSAWLLLLLVSGSSPVAAQPITVQAVNASVPTACAEHDNVYMQLWGEEVGRFRILATQPAYIDEIRLDTTAPDWRDCPPEPPPPSALRFEPRQMVLYEGNGLRLVGYVHEHFWRAEEAVVRVGEREERGLHLLQLWATDDGELEEIIALYPPDGYWRPRPFPGPHLADSVYGSSFLIGPVEERGRPIVDVASVGFDPATLTFDVGFRAGGTATLRLEEISDRQLAIAVTLDPPVIGTAPFAAVRSMFVNPWRADVTAVSWRRSPQGDLQQEAVESFDRASGTQFRFERPQISLHNTSAPDLVFEEFAPAGAP